MRRFMQPRQRAAWARNTECKNECCRGLATYLKLVLGVLFECSFHACLPLCLGSEGCEFAVPKSGRQESHTLTIPVFQSDRLAS